MKVLLTIVFIGAVGAGAFLIAQRPTKLSGEVIADDLLAQLKVKGINEVYCADSVIGRSGAEFVCQVGATDGSHALIRYAMDRAGGISGETMSSTMLADDLLGQLKDKGIEALTCGDVDFDPDGASVTCQVGGSDGSHTTIRYSRDHKGSISGTQVADKW